jgi:hypothetical protein
MISTARQVRLCAPRLVAAPIRRAPRTVKAMASGSGFDIDKFVDDLPVPVEYAYAGVAWGAGPNSDSAGMQKHGRTTCVGFIP